LSTSRELTVPVDAKGQVTALVYEAHLDRVGATLLLGHGAGANQRSPFMVRFATFLAERGVDIVTFNFLYSEQRRRAPDRTALLEACYLSAIEAVREHVPSARAALFLGGKSMGGRIATHVAAANPDQKISGVILLGYPLHPPGRPLERRDAHLPRVGRPMHFVQGSRDSFGTPGELEPVLDRLSPRATLHVVEGGDHSFKVRGTSAAAQDALFEEVAGVLVNWITEVARRGDARR